MTNKADGRVPPEPASDFFSIGLKPLHAALADGIARIVHEESMQPGTRLSEKQLALELGVSRFPVRATLGHLKRLGYVERRGGGTMLSARLPLPPSPPQPSSAFELLLARIARDRLQGLLRATVSEQSLAGDYGVARAAAQQALRRLVRLGLLERDDADRWQFSASAYSVDVKRDCYRFRMLLEPAALCEAEFKLPTHWEEDMVARHEAFLYSPWLESSSVAFFDMNAAFHEGLAAASGNQLVVDEIRRINRRRRLANYAWPHGRDRVDASCREHLAILACIGKGHMNRAAALMRRHLASASRVTNKHSRLDG